MSIGFSSTANDFMASNMARYPNKQRPQSHYKLSLSFLEIRFADPCSDRCFRHNCLQFLSLLVDCSLSVDCTCSLPCRANKSHTDCRCGRRDVLVLGGIQSEGCLFHQSLSQSSHLQPPMERDTRCTKRIHTYIYTYIYTYIHTYIHTYMEI